jgi:hypothetical protein
MPQEHRHLLVEPVYDTGGGPVNGLLGAPAPRLAGGNSAGYGVYSRRPRPAVFLSPEDRSPEE